MAYSDLLKDPKWQKKRLHILKRDKWTCKCCGSKDKTLHVHHFTYQTGKKPWEYPDDNFITLCYSCHEDEESFIRDQNASFVAISRRAKYPIGSMYRASYIFAALWLSNKKEYSKLKAVINKFYDNNLDAIEALEV
jgi:hypothetical protein